MQSKIMSINPGHMPHLAPRSCLFLSVKRQMRLRIGQMIPSGRDIVADQIAHLDPPETVARAERPAADGADMLLEL